MGIVCTIGFSLIGLRYALLIGIVAGLLEFIPLVGPLVVAVVAVIIAGFSSVKQAVSVALFLGLLRIVEDYVIYPRIIGQGTHLHPLALIVAVLCGAELAGMAGVFLAIPTAAIMSVCYRHWLVPQRGVKVQQTRSDLPRRSWPSGRQEASLLARLTANSAATGPFRRCPLPARERGADQGVPERPR
jgi:predicted PurR-regulated permease PerM